MSWCAFIAEMNLLYLINVGSSGELTPESHQVESVYRVYRGASNDRLGRTLTIAVDVEADLS